MSEELLQRLRNWYSSRDAADVALRRRATVASQFVQFGLLADDIERFTHFFVALDALFGVRGKVEATVTAGVERVFSESTWVDRASRLFDLRSEILHGGSSAIEEWSWYEDYRRHFKSEPLRDVTELALRCLRDFFG